MPEPTEAPAVTPFPTPTTFDVKAVPPGLVLLVVRTLSGVGYYFLLPKDARSLATLIDKVAMQASSGLIVPNGQIPKGPDPEAN
jgi:hypothetical protein